MKRILSIAILVLLTAFAYAQKKPTKLAPKKAAPVAAAPAADTVKAPVKTARKKLKVPPKDGFYARKDIDSTEMVPLADVREEDVFYAKRIWREIDLRDTVNSALKSPKSRLIDVLIAAIKKDELTAYSPIDSALNEDDAFKNVDNPKAKMDFFIERIKFYSGETSSHFGQSSGGSRMKPSTRAWVIKKSFSDTFKTNGTL